MKSLSLLLAALVLAGCQTYSLVKPGTVEVADAIRVQPTFEWSRTSFDNIETWTINGSDLEAVQFTTGVKDGQSIFRQSPRLSQESLPKYRKGMTPLEIQDLVVSSLRVAGAQTIEVHSPEPVTINGTDAFRSEFTYVLENGLVRQAIAFTAVKDDELNLILYYGAKMHYFGRYKDDVERLFKTIEIL